MPNPAPSSALSAPTATNAEGFVVLKFGGTSVATAARWRTILDQARARADAGLRPVVVCSAVTKISDLLEKLVGEAVQGRHEPVLAQLRARHAELAKDLGVDLEAAIGAELDEIGRLALGASLVKEVSPRLLARVMGMGEILSTKLGAAFMNAEGFATAWVDARSCFLAIDDDKRPEALRVLSATVSDDKDPALRARFDGLFDGTVDGGAGAGAGATAPARCVLTQGFIARDDKGATVLLGRGGSDTSAAYFAARLQAVRCEIWTDVPGIFTADPRVIPSALLVRAASYGEAQEIASMGAKVLHPRSIPPCRRHRIPLEIRWTDRPQFEGTTIEKSERTGVGLVKAITHKRGVTLVSMETAGMWQQVGFLADVFACFKARGLSVDLVSTSEMNVTASLDASANTLDDATLAALIADLQRFCKAKIIPNCAAVSLVGRRIRAILHELGPVLSVFQEHTIHLVSQAASDLNLTFVVDEDQAERLVRSLHALLFTTKKGDGSSGQVFGTQWRELFEDAPAPTSMTAQVAPWWSERREELLALAHKHSPAYVYDEDTLRGSIAALQNLSAVDRVFYAIKANPNADILKIVVDSGLGLECVSHGELAHVLTHFPDLDRGRILFTSNFAPKSELQAALAAGVRITVDSLHILERWGELLAGKEIFLRVDPGAGRGHHDYVKTAGQQSKFGIGIGDLDKAKALADKAKVKVTGLHAHSGSGILEPDSWAEVTMVLAQQAERFPDVSVLDIGGGLGVPEKPGQGHLDLALVNAALQKAKAATKGYALWMEPGRFVVARAGALLARVTQLKTKGSVGFVGVDAGMNALIRPALYGAYHEIVNLSRLGEKATMTAHVVGPVCESGDVLGYGRRLPTPREGDVLLVGTAGAYGAAMASRYNLREPPLEVLLRSR